MTLMAVEKIPVQNRIDLAEAAIECAKHIHDSYRSDTFDGRKERARRAEAIDALLDELSTLYLERLIEAVT